MENQGEFCGAIHPIAGILVPGRPEVQCYSQTKQVDCYREFLKIRQKGDKTDGDGYSKTKCTSLSALD